MSPAVTHSECGITSLGGSGVPILLGPWMPHLTAGGDGFTQGATPAVTLGECSTPAVTLGECSTPPVSFTEGGI